MTPVKTKANPSTTMTMGRDNAIYGIPFGQWVKVRLEREVTNADNGDIELYLVDPLSGKKRDVEAGTILFANKQFNEATKRMDLTVSKAIKPNDETISLKAVVYDSNKISGLAGTLERDRIGEAKSAIGRSTLQVVDTVVDSTKGQSVAGQASGNVANEMLAHEGRYLEKAPNALIRVYPQDAYIRIVESF